LDHAGAGRHQARLASDGSVARQKKSGGNILVAGGEIGAEWDKLGHGMPSGGSKSVIFVAYHEFGRVLIWQF